MAGQWLFWSAVGLVALFILAQLGVSPGAVIWRAVRAAALGSLLVLCGNWAGQFVHLHLPLNPVTVFIAGLLGVPGWAAMLVLHTWVLPAA